MGRQYQTIPVPLKQRLKELRVKALPLLVFFIAGFSVYQLWTDKVSSPGMIGEVVAGQSSVSSPKSGFLINFYYTRFDVVQQGQLIGQIMQIDSLVLNAQLELIRREIDYLRESLDPIIDEQRNILNFEDLKLEQMQSRIALVRVELQRRQTLANYNRIADLHDRQLVSEQEFESIRTELELLTVQSNELTELIDYLDIRIAEIEDVSGYGTRADRDPVQAAIKVQEQRMETILAESAPVPLYAPISGIISHIWHRQGEYVAEGNSILQIDSREPAFIVGFVRQPVSIQPYAGMEVEVRTRRPGRSFFKSNIEQVGGHIRIIDENMQRPGVFFESGLPVKIHVHSRGDIQLTPGEIVDIVMRP
jgi:multidrug resistance efflux pump